MSTQEIAAGKLKRREKSTRYWEIDTLRGVAIIMMIIFHLVWDLWFFGVLPNWAPHSGFWHIFQRITANLFIILVGVSLTVSYSRQRLVQNSKTTLFRYFLLRGLRIFAYGMAITLVVGLSGVGYVHFGILHLIGFSIIAAYPFLPYRWLNLALWLLFYWIGGYLQTVHVGFPWLAWMGLTPRIYFPVDYFPIFPWFGVVLLGVFIGNSLYAPGGRTFRLPDLSDWMPARTLQFLGRHSLLIYLIHQPILFAILALLGIINLGF